MTDITAARHPGRIVLVSGLLGHRAVVEQIAQLLVDPAALQLAQQVATAAAVCAESPNVSADDAYTQAMNALAEHVGAEVLMFHDWDLEGVAAVVAERRAVLAA